MRIHRYWARGTATGRDAQGETIAVSARGSSDESRESAVRSAVARAESIVRRLAAGEELNRYPYPDRALAEPVLREIAAANGRAAVLTRNGYGAVVLNTASMLIADIDLPRAEGGGVSKFFSLFLKKNADTAATSAETQLIARISACATKERLSVRLYRTKGGLRAIVTNRVIAPKSGEAARLLRDLNSDPLYCRLCEGQESYRARLTPKPWRIGVERPPVQFPFETAQAVESMQRWEERYGQACRKWAVCELVGEYGGGSVCEGFDTLIKIHDDECAVTSGKPLA